MRPGKAIGGILYCLFLANFGCGSFRSAQKENSAEKLYAVKAESTAIYYHSPRQGHGPDQVLARDTQMKLIRFSSGFCKVKLLTGEAGYVANEDIAVAPADLVAASNTSSASPAIATNSAWRAEIPEPRSSAPEAPLPQFEPTPLPEPSNFGN